jgi:hypothetical protein
MDWPLEYRVITDPDAYGGMFVDGSQIGLRMNSVKDIPAGAKVNIRVLFSKEFQLTNFEVKAEIVWKDLCLKEDWNGYQYGLKFIQIKEDDLQKLLQLFLPSIPNGEDLN